MILYINSCVREESRTGRLARALLKNLGNYHELKLDESDFYPLNRERLERRTKLIEAENYGDPMFDAAKQFAEAEMIVIAAPYWDGSFPAVL